MARKGKTKRALERALSYIRREWRLCLIRTGGVLLFDDVKMQPWESACNKTNGLNERIATG